MNKKLIIILAVANIPIYWILLEILFGGVRGLKEMLFFIAKPDMFSAMDGQRVNDNFSTAKFIAFIFVCAIVVWSEYVLIQRHFM